jgi:hypothetical protein
MLDIHVIHVNLLVKIYEHFPGYFTSQPLYNLPNLSQANLAKQD